MLLDILLYSRLRLMGGLKETRTKAEKCHISIFIGPQLSSYYDEHESCSECYIFHQSHNKTNVYSARSHETAFGLCKGGTRRD